jgi:acyl-coenzyme A synthetase/AMP-(fatty) acid ligase
MQQSKWHSLWDSVTAAERRPNHSLVSADASVALGELVEGSSIGERLEELSGRSVLIATKSQLAASLALVELDGIARRLVLCPPDLPSKHLPFVIEAAAVDAVVSDCVVPETAAPGVKCVVTCTSRVEPARSKRRSSQETEWILLTSGTTGLPKMVSHTLSSLAGAITRSATSGNPIVWSTFYDIRRYGGLQILLRALLGGASLVLSSAEESTGDFLIRAGACGVTHISGTPSHWRRALMSPSAREIAPRYIRLSGEIADQAILDNLRAFYQQAKVVHAFASTEAGVAFEVGDGLMGFPTNIIDERNPSVKTKIENGSLRIHSERNATRYLGSQDQTLANTDGFVDTGDMIEQRGGRYYFVGRRDGTINVGGSKVHPEEVEAVINQHPSVRMSLVKARKNPIIGAVVVAEVVAKHEPDASGLTAELDALKKEIFQTCRRTLAPYKVPATIRFVPSLEVAPSGQLARCNA